MFEFFHELDVFVLQTINHSFHNFYTDLLAFNLSYMGVIYFWVIVMILLYLFGGQKAKSVAKRMFIVLVLVVIVSVLLKELILRPRPYTQLTGLIVLDPQTDYSFPSGHTIIATSMSYVLAKEYNKYILMIIPVIVALTRLYMGVHYPSDVMGGFLIGLIIAYLVERYINNTKRIREKL